MFLSIVGIEDRFIIFIGDFILYGLIFILFGFLFRFDLGLNYYQYFVNFRYQIIKQNILELKENQVYKSYFINLNLIIHQKR